LLAALLAEPYFAQPAPKSTGRDLFHAAWLDRMLAGRGGVAPADVQATLTRLTAVTIARGIAQETAASREVFVCGGGAYNATLLGMLEEETQAPVRSTAALGVEPNRVEALAFAWLGYCFSKRKAGNLPAVTGARGPRVLGALYPA
jgi:anhydro-N-acetylmuramic acid kinase